MIPYSDEQLAVVKALQAAGKIKICILTGPPGVGKTTMAKVIMSDSRKRWGPQSTVALSPTGKAAKRFTEVTGHPCVTIHRALIPWERAAQGGNPWPVFADGIPPQGAVRAVLIDEASMVDQQMMLRLLAALPPWIERLIFVGDADQLPSVGAGCVLRDLIACGKIPVFRLTRVYRQDEHSWIRINAQRINRGERPTSDALSKDWFEETCEEAEDIGDRVVALARKYPRAQVLTPTHKGTAGAIHLNRVVRDALNPRNGRVGWTAGDTTFYRGDRVIHIVNDYVRDVFNGEVGVTIGIVLDENGDECMAVDYDGRKVLYDEESAAYELRLAFALTIHKSQGSEYPDVIAVIHSTHSFLLSRQLLYVAVSRARQRCWIVGDEKGLTRAVRNNQIVQRRTRLKERIREAFDEAAA